MEGGAFFGGGGGGGLAKWNAGPLFVNLPLVTELIVEQPWLHRGYL